MPSWLRSLAFDRSPSAAKALSGLKAHTAEPNPVAVGVALLQNSSVETLELGPLAKLPPFAPVVIRLLRLFDRDEVEQAEIARLVEADPALTAEILGVVNSPLYAIRGRVTSPAHGVAMLGVEQMKALATTLAMRALLSGSPKTPIVRRFWKHSVASAAIAQEMAPLFTVDKGLGYIAAMVHDLGRIGLLAAHGEAYGSLATTVHQSVEEILEIERTRFGMDHCHAGALLSRAWGLPKSLREGVKHHHDECSDRRILGLVQLSCRLANGFMFQSILHRNPHTPAETMESFVPKAMHQDLTARLQSLELAAFQTIESFDF
ncbi:hypothetical protein SBA3_1470006 [Candidatus Sulfopaludibacter sp. SbA3]|nr:hypothetical protein SBA3_1470006 [Candidatus Sulfopaludibacter sp. SbA3]